MSFKASAVSAHEEPLPSSHAMKSSSPSATHTTAPEVNGHALKILLSQFAFAPQLAPPKNRASYFKTHSSSPSKGVVVGVDVIVVVGDVVADDVGVVVVVRVVLGVDVTVVVAVLVAVVVPVVVGELVAVVVGVDVADVVGLVVGVVISHS